jgi:hypothetical protein
MCYYISMSNSHALPTSRDRARAETAVDAVERFRAAVVSGEPGFIGYFAITSAIHGEAHELFCEEVGVPSDSQPGSEVIVCEGGDELLDGVSLYRETHEDMDGVTAGVLYLVGEYAETWQSVHQ